MSDQKQDYTVEVEEREEASPVYGEVFLDGDDLMQFELYTAAQTAKGFDGESGQSVFHQELELAKTIKANGSPEIIAEINKTNELLVLAVTAEDLDDTQLQRALEPFLDWLHATAKGVHYLDGVGFYDASARI